MSISYNPHPLSVFTPGNIIASEVGRSSWNTQWQDRGQNVNDPESDRYIYYTTELAEVRLREDRCGKLEVLMVIWCSGDPSGIKLYRKVVQSSLDNDRQRVAFLKRLVRDTEKFNAMMQKVNRYAKLAPINL